MKELIERLEKATGPDRELDGEIALLLDPDTRRVNPGRWVGNEVPAYTSSVDDALTLIPQGWRVGSIVEGAIGPWFVSLWDNSVRHLAARSEAPTLPLALCIAALRARAHP